MAVVEDLGVNHETVPYMKEPLDRAQLEKLVAGLEDPVEDLVRKDSKFKKLGLDAADYVGNPQAVIDLLLEHKALMQRPVLSKGGKSIIGRPKSRVEEFLGSQ